MRQVQLGRTGISASRYALGTMMLGAWGNADHEDAGRLVNLALFAPEQVVEARWVAERFGHGRAHREPAEQRRAPDDGIW